MAENQVNAPLIDHLAKIGNMFSDIPDAWRSRAFFKVVGKLRAYKTEIVLNDGKLDVKIDGVGDAIKTVIEQFLSTGTSDKFAKVKAKLEEVKPKRHDSVKVKKILDGYLGILTDYGIDWGYAGSLRRGLPDVKDVDVIICLSDESVKDTIRQALEFQGLTADIRDGAIKWGMTVPLDNGETIALDLNFCKPENRGAYYNYFTGSKEYNIALRSIAKSMGLKINEYGIFRGKEKLGGENEMDQFTVMGIPWLEPKDRTGKNIPVIENT